MTNDSPVSVQPPASASIISLVCRICYDGDKEEYLISPCDCRGTIGFVHQTCLENWLAESNSNTCELCQYVFDLERHPKYNSTESVWHWCRTSSNTIAPVQNDVLCCSVVTPLTIVITYICLLSSQYYSQAKFNNEPSARWTSFSLLCMIAIMYIGYYTWVYAVIRMHGRRWYYWWQRTCTVSLRLPPERSTKVTVASLKVTNEAVPARVPDRDSTSTVRFFIVNEIVSKIIPANLPERSTAPLTTVSERGSTSHSRHHVVVPERLPEGDITLDLCESQSDLPDRLPEGDSSDQLHATRSTTEHPLSEDTESRD